MSQAVASGSGPSAPRPAEAAVVDHPAPEGQDVVARPAGAADGQAPLPNGMQRRERRVGSSNDEWKDIDEAIVEHYETSKMEPHVEECARRYVRDLEDLLNCHEFGLTRLHESEVVLSIVGSLGSGIATKYSDVDICVRFKNSPNEAPTQPVQLNFRVLAKIAEVVKCCEGVEVKMILNTRVPILQFSVRRGFVILSIEVSYYSMTSLHSSSLIRAYCEWEPILPALIMWTKKWAATCDICDPAKKALPKFAYTIMLIHYMQKRHRLPRLQHDFAKYDNAIDKATAGYFHKRVERWWYRPNRHTVGRLFLGFLEFFSEFKWWKMISMRSCRPRSNVPGMMGEFMTIENPFSGEHNLGKRIGRTMFIHILTAIKRSRNVFRALDVNALRQIVAVENFHKSLGTALLTTCYGNRRCPDLSQCTGCGRYGHYLQDCGGPDGLRKEPQDKLPPLIVVQFIYQPPVVPVPAVVDQNAAIAQQNAALGG